MSFDKDRAIIGQNAATAAATLLQGTGAGYEEFEALRTAIAEGSLAFAYGKTAVERVQDAFEGSQVVTEEAVPAQPTTQPRPQAGGHDPGTLVLKFGKHRGKTIAQVADEDPSWLEWAAGNSSNDFVKGRIKAFLAAA